jgi:hypothetical protein
MTADNNPELVTAMQLVLKLIQVIGGILIAACIIALIPLQACLWKLVYKYVDKKVDYFLAEQSAEISADACRRELEHYDYSTVDAYNICHRKGPFAIREGE